MARARAKRTGGNGAVPVTRRVPNVGIELMGGGDGFLDRLPGLFPSQNAKPDVWRRVWRDMERLQPELQTLFETIRTSDDPSYIRGFNDGFQCGCRVGQILRSAHVRQVEPVAEIGDKVVGGGSKGFVTTYGDPAERERERQDIVADLIAVQRANPEWGVGKVDGHVAGKHGCSTKKIYRIRQIRLRK
ncbi:MAG: hypothetical protein HOP29_17205 [Phycisphaerales bacterium]|nr:hypothetical protein [Phycisphaerales bacterium]